MVELLDFRSHSKSRPFATQPLFDHSKSRLVRISDPNCIWFVYIFCRLMVRNGRRCWPTNVTSGNGWRTWWSSWHVNTRTSKPWSGRSTRYITIRGARDLCHQLDQQVTQNFIIFGRKKQNQLNKLKENRGFSKCGRRTRYLQRTGGACCFWGSSAIAYRG